VQRLASIDNRLPRGAKGAVMCSPGLARTFLGPAKFLTHSGTPRTRPSSSDAPSASLRELDTHTSDPNSVLPQ